MKCMDCGEVVRPNQHGAYREVKGWEKLRVKGGGNGLALRTATGNLLCGGCCERRKLNDRHGIVPGQTSLI